MYHAIQLMHLKSRYGTRTGGNEGGRSFHGKLK